MLMTGQTRGGGAEQEVVAEDCDSEWSNGTARVLIVDDHQMLREGLMALLTRCRISTWWARRRTGMKRSMPP